METSKILDVVEKKLKYNHFAREQLLSFMYDGLLFVSSRFRLPFLMYQDFVGAAPGGDYIELSEEYQHDLYRAVNSTTEEECRIFYNRLALDHVYGTEIRTGDVESVSVEGRNLLYRLSPEEEQTITIEYYRTPDLPIDTTNNEPECLPEHLHNTFLVNYVLFLAYSEIEGNNDTQKNDSLYFKEIYERSLEGLQLFLRESPIPRKIIPRRACWF